MADRNDGGPAFPTLSPSFDGNCSVTDCRGLSLRDYFAAAALPYCAAAVTYSPDYDWNARVAQRCYQLADALLRQRTQ